MMLQVCLLSEDFASLVSVTPLHLAIQAILDRYPMVLDPPTELPPSRPCNHIIPLIPGAQPVCTHIATRLH
jgi:hypothetical protein